MVVGVVPFQVKMVMPPTLHLSIFQARSTPSPHVFYHVGFTRCRCSARDAIRCLWSSLLKGKGVGTTAAAENATYDLQVLLWGDDLNA